MPKLSKIIFFFIAVMAVNLYGTIANAQWSDRPDLPNIEIIKPDKSVPPSLAAFSGIWLGKWDETYYAALAVKNIHPDGIADIEYRWVEYVGSQYSLGNAKLAKIENGTLSFGRIKLTIQPGKSNEAVGELVGSSPNGPVHRLSYFTKVQ